MAEPLKFSAPSKGVPGLGLRSGGVETPEHKKSSCKVRWAVKRGGSGPWRALAGPGCAVSSDGRPLLGIVLPTASLVCLLSASGEKTPGGGEAAAGAESSRDRDTWDKEHGPGHPESRTSRTVLCWEGLVGKGVAGSQGSTGERSTSQGKSSGLRRP